jgi:penicillin amidase
VLAGLGIPGAPVGPTIDVVGQALSPAGRALCGGDCGPLLATSLQETTAALGPGWETSPWGALHQAVFAHPLLGRLPVIGGWATWRIPQPGDDSTIFRGSPRSPGWESVHGPGYRGVYDLADLDRSLFAATPGQSGNPFSADASSMMRRWRDGEPVRLGPRPQTIRGSVELLP